MYLLPLERQHMCPKSERKTDGLPSLSIALLVLLIGNAIQKEIGMARCQTSEYSGCIQLSREMVRNPLTVDLRCKTVNQFTFYIINAVHNH